LKISKLQCRKAPLPSPPSQYPGHTRIRFIRKSPGTVSPIFQTTGKKISHPPKGASKSKSPKGTYPLSNKENKESTYELTHQKTERVYQCVSHASVGGGKEIN